MAKSRFEYVKKFEINDSLLPNTWLVIRVDGCSFHRFSDEHNFDKPNDAKALQLMTACARKTMNKFPQLRCAYGQSDEYSFIYPPKANPHSRRSSKLTSVFASTFAAQYCFMWRDFFPDRPLLFPPAFDGRVVQYPTVENIRDYLSWRQADCHINNLYNTSLWALIKGGLSPQEATKRLSGTNSSDKNEILFREFGRNYNNEPDIFKKGTFLYRKQPSADAGDSETIQELYGDIIKDKFWNEHGHLLNL